MREIKQLKDIETLTVKSVKREDGSLVIYFEGYDNTPLKVSAYCGCGYDDPYIVCYLVKQVPITTYKEDFVELR